MKIVEPKVEQYNYKGNDNSHIAKCARICYASSNTNYNSKFVESLWKNKHYSMYRHVPVYYIIPFKPEIPFECASYCNIVINKGNWYISTNLQVHKEYLSKYDRYRISDVLAENTEIFWMNKMIYITLCVDTSIDITREYNRKSPNAIAEQSTRYVDFIKKIGIKFKKCHWMYKCNIYRTFLYKFMLKTSEWFYKIARSKYGLNLPPQDARFILPLDTMSKVVYTYTIKEWEYILNMRLWDWTGKAHPDAKIIAKQIYEILNSNGYDIEQFKNKII